MTERRPTDPARRVLVLVTVLVTTLSLLPTAAPVATTAVSADCGGALGSAGDGGAAFVADSGFTVFYDDTEPMPDSGVFRNDSAMQFRNVTLVANGSASLRLVNGTGTETCYGEVNASSTPITVAPADGGATVVVEDAVQSLSVGPATVDSGSATLAYESSSAWSVSIAVDAPDGTELVAEAAESGATLDEGTVENGSIALRLPAGSHAVILASPSSGGGGSGPPSSTATPTSTATSTLTTTSPGGGGGSGQATATSTRTASPTSTRTTSPTSTRTASPTSTRTTSPTPTRTTSPTPTGSPEPTAATTAPSPTGATTGTDAPDGVIPAIRGGNGLSLVVLLVVLLGAVGAGAWRLRAG